jgi:cell division protein FtsX
MTRENWWIAAKIFLGLPVLLYALLSVLEPQKTIWRKPTKKVLMAFIIAWSAVLCFIVLLFVWNAQR